MTAVLSGSAPAPAWSTAWADALADLEMSVDEAEELLVAARRTGAVDAASAVTAARGWTPPSNLGLLPAPLVERATALLNRQLRVAQQLTEAAAHSRRQLRAVEGMRATAESGPVYLDTAG
jgi:hypothetical protein